MLIANVESTTLATVAYDQGREVLQLEFCNVHIHCTACRVGVSRQPRHRRGALFSWGLCPHTPGIYRFRARMAHRARSFWDG
jgi:hypothetical protein